MPKKNKSKALEIVEVVDRLGLLTEQIKTLSAEADSLKEYLRNLGAGKYEGEKYTASVTESVKRTYDPIKVAKVLGKKFVEVVTVSATKLKNYIAPVEMEKLVLDETVEVRVSLTKK